MKRVGQNWQIAQDIMPVGALFLNQTLCRKFNGSNLTAFQSAKILVCIQLELCVYEFTGK